MDIVKEIEEKLGIESITEVTDSRFKMFDDGGIEIETGLLLYGLIRRLKPKRILETGLYSAISTMFMACALRDNGFGHIDTLEFEDFHIKRGQERLGKMGLQGFVTIYHISSLDFIPTMNYQLMLNDTELHLRFSELVNFYPNLDEGGYILIHDMPRSLCQGNVNPDHPDFKNWPVGELPPAFLDLVKSGKLKSFYFGGARGLVGFYRPHREDFI
ncbi:class I SAM-dependent methyltransferase [Candidatus Dojkabacteria bacterium]|jgi:predicted O-methyltransferase YrrM|nr:class I SAM-dependent methyltransferase [Candidatus Dojkabacteria bacterium]